MFSNKTYLLVVKHLSLYFTIHDAVQLVPSPYSAFILTVLTLLRSNNIDCRVLGRLNAYYFRANVKMPKVLKTFYYDLKRTITLEKNDPVYSPLKTQSYDFLFPLKGAFMRIEIEFQVLLNQCILSEFLKFLGSLEFTVGCK